MNGDICYGEFEIIDDNDELFRRFTQDQIKPNGKVSSAAFQNTSDTDEMSVDLGKLSSIENSSNFKGSIYGVASFHAGHARKLEQVVFHDPDYICDNYAHTTVKGKKSDRRKKHLANGAIVKFNPF